VASIGFGLPHAAVDGNVKRVIARLTNGAGDARQVADELLDRKNPSRWNQAMMELGATVCLPRYPLCEACPIERYCAAKARGTQSEWPRKRAKPDTIRIEKTLLVIREGERILLAPSARVKGFWDLPEPFRGARIGASIGRFRHAITHHSYVFTVVEAVSRTVPKGFRWFACKHFDEIPLSTTAKKGLQCLIRV